MSVICIWTVSSYMTFVTFLARCCCCSFWHRHALLPLFRGWTCPSLNIQACWQFHFWKHYIALLLFHLFLSLSLSFSKILASPWFSLSLLKILPCIDSQLPSLISLFIFVWSISEANPKNNWMRGEQACLFSQALMSCLFLLFNPMFLQVSRKADARTMQGGGSLVLDELSSWSVSLSLYLSSVLITER